MGGCAEGKSEMRGDAMGTGGLTGSSAPGTPLSLPTLWVRLVLDLTGARGELSRGAITGTASHRSPPALGRFFCAGGGFPDPGSNPRGGNTGLPGGPRARIAGSGRGLGR